MLRSRVASISRARSTSTRRQDVRRRRARPRDGLSSSLAGDPRGRDLGTRAGAVPCAEVLRDGRRAEARALARRRAPAFGCTTWTCASSLRRCSRREWQALDRTRARRSRSSLTSRPRPRARGSPGPSCTSSARASSRRSRSATWRSRDARFRVEGFRMSSTAGGLRLDGSYDPKRHQLSVDAASTPLDLTALMRGVGLEDLGLEGTLTSTPSSQRSPAGRRPRRSTKRGSFASTTSRAAKGRGRRRRFPSSPAA